MRTLFKPEIKTFNNERILSSSSSAAAFSAASVGVPAAKVFIMKPPGHESEKHKLGLIVCIGIVAGNMIEGIALLPANLASIGSISLIGWIIVVIGAMPDSPPSIRKAAALSPTPVKSAPPLAFNRAFFTTTPTGSET